MAYFLRTTGAKGRSYGGFQWPMKVGATVTAPDWKPTADCGNGLHGLMDGLGDSDMLDWSSDALWWIVESDDATAIDLSGKHKFQTCNVVAFGNREDVTAAMYALRPGPIHGLTITGGDGSTLTGGDGSNLTGGDMSNLTGGYKSNITGGDGSNLTGGYKSNLTGGDWSTLTGGDWSTLTGGGSSTLTGGNSSTLTGGNRSTLTGGNRSNLTGGDMSNLTGGDWSTLTGGDWSTLTGGDMSRLTGGDKSTLIFLRWIDGIRRVLTAYVGEDGIRPGVTYMASADHKSVVEA